MDNEDMIGIYGPRAIKWLYTTIEGLVDEEIDVDIEMEIQGERVTFKVLVANTDLGKVIGKEGRHARALRLLLFARGRKDGAIYALELAGHPKPIDPQSAMNQHVLGALGVPNA